MYLYSQDHDSDYVWTSNIIQQAFRILTKPIILCLG